MFVLSSIIIFYLCSMVSFFFFTLYCPFALLCVCSDNLEDCVFVVMDNHWGVYTLSELNPPISVLFSLLIPRMSTTS